MKTHPRCEQRCTSVSPSWRSRSKTKRKLRGQEKRATRSASCTSPARPRLRRFSGRASPDDRARRRPAYHRWWGCRSPIRRGMEVRQLEEDGRRCGGAACATRCPVSSLPQLTRRRFSLKKGTRKKKKNTHTHRQQKETIIYLLPARRSCFPPFLVYFLTVPLMKKKKEKKEGNTTKTKTLKISETRKEH